MLSTSVRPGRLTWRMWWHACSTVMWSAYQLCASTATSASASTLHAAMRRARSCSHSPTSKTTALRCACAAATSSDLRARAVCASVCGQTCFLHACKCGLLSTMQGKAYGKAAVSILRAPCFTRACQPFVACIVDANACALP
jgi:hypothetical protein